MQSPGADPSRLCAPLVIGVTGHRDLREQDRAELEKRVRAILIQLRGEYPSTPLLLLSPLAEGADRLVARVALSSDISARLVVPMPMPKALYEVDFHALGSVAEFRGLLGKADYSFELPLVPDKKYEEAGRYIARECQILIALWDGVVNNKSGGTSAVVKCQLEGPGEHHRADFHPPELFPVYHIVTKHESDHYPAGEPFELKEIYPKGFADHAKAKAYYSKIFHNLDEFNREIVEGGEALAADSAKSTHDLIGDFDESKLSAEEAATLHRFAAADALANEKQRKLVRLDRFMHCNVFVWFIVLVMFAHHPDHPALLLLLAMVIAGVGGLFYMRAQRTELDNRCQDYRAIAEGCRVRFFWQVGGLKDSVAEHYLAKQRTELDWIRNGLRGWGIGPRDSADSAGDRLEFVLKYWIDGQHHYYERAAEHNLEQSERKEKVVKTFLLLAFLVAIGILGMAAYQQWDAASWWECKECEKWIGWPILAIDVLLALSALFHHASTRMAHAEHFKQYKRMQSVFQNAAEVVRERLRSNDVEGARTSLRRLGQEALAENGDWVMLHRERPLELPHP